MLIRRLLVTVSRHAPVVAVQTLADPMLSDPSNLEMITVGLESLVAVILTPPSLDPPQVGRSLSPVPYQRWRFHTSCYSPSPPSNRGRIVTRLWGHACGISKLRGPSRLQAEDADEASQHGACGRVLEFMRSGGDALEAHSAAQYRGELSLQLGNFMKLSKSVFGSSTLVASGRCAPARAPPSSPCPAANSCRTTPGV